MNTSIRYYHNSIPIIATASFNFSDQLKAVEIKNSNGIEDLGEKIVLIKENGRWVTDSSISSDHRSTYLNLLNEINWVFSQNDSLRKIASQLSQPLAKTA